MIVKFNTYSSIVFFVVCVYKISYYASIINTLLILLNLLLINFFQGDLKDPVFREKKVKSVSLLLTFIKVVAMVVDLTFDKKFIYIFKHSLLSSVFMPFF